MMKDALASFSHGQERLARDFRAVVEDAEELLRHTSQDAGGPEMTSHT